MARYSMTRATVSAVVLAAMFTACGGYIKQEQYDNDMAELRSEMNDQIAAGDQQVGDAANRRIDALESQLQSLQNDLGSLSSDFDAKMAQMEGRLYVEMPVFFAFDDSAIRDGDKPVLDQFATVIREHHPNVVITVEGFTDPAGDPDYNQWLGQQRANAVREYLVQQGQLNGDNVKAVSYGEASNRQVAPGAWGDEGLANRRVTLVIEYVG